MAISKDDVKRLSQDEGLFDKEIADKLHCTRVTVTRIRQKNDIPSANLSNRKDKRYVCMKCGTTVYIRRSEKKQIYCPKCSLL